MYRSNLVRGAPRPHHGTARHRARLTRLPALGVFSRSGPTPARPHPEDRGLLLRTDALLGAALVPDQGVTGVIHAHLSATGPQPALHEPGRGSPELVVSEHDILDGIALGLA